MSKLKESLNKVNSKYLKENAAKQLFKLFTEAREYVEPGVADKIQQIIDLLKQEDHTNMHSRQKFVDLLYQLTELENDSDDRRTSVRKFFKYVSQAITDYEADIADDSDMFGENKNKEQAMKLKEIQQTKGFRDKDELINAIILYFWKNATEEDLNEIRGSSRLRLDVDPSLSELDRFLIKIINKYEWENLWDVWLKTSDFDYVYNTFRNNIIGHKVKYGNTKTKFNPKNMFDSKNKYQTPKLKEAEKWSGDVETKKHPPEDLFSTGSAEDIAKWAKSSHKDLQSAMGALNFYINRAGSNISTGQKNKVETAKDKLSKMYENKLDNLKNVISEAKKRIYKNKK